MHSTVEQYDNAVGSTNPLVVVLFYLKYLSDANGSLKKNQNFMLMWHDSQLN